MDAYDLSTIVIVGLLLFVWLLPFIIILSSNRTRGREKLAWILGVIFISWFAWIFYLLLAPVSRQNARVDQQPSEA
ncbi:hypothetical protein H1R16_02580 [Marnyiella aurantia]|uniref:Cardiolipin synthase N-terminal domain-containing protein n=1 Tax=Marnyiella aurantia TaxID=2758037 RepID=A0A7D7RL42_9FLAO|nr:hypothetical protein [Marnyiella aurantia]MBA5245680.1 hypothetical protein [Marnyiella aurantia]QMS98912.1 hypothetical protein H1R16_02580 [Marnyiella aurantia]